MTALAIKPAPYKPHEATGDAETLRKALAEVRKATLKPPPLLTVSEWADEYAYLSMETTGFTGRFEAFAYQRGILDAVSDPTIKTITVMKSARIGYTKCLDTILGYFIHQDPSPMLVVQPRVEDAEDYSRTEIAPMLRDTPVLAEIAGDIKSRDSDQRILKRMFRNGASISFVGANSPGGFRRITARVVAFDEVDGYDPGGAGAEGDQIALGKKRSETFWNRKIILGSTPTIKGISRIEKAMEDTDLRRYQVPCPHCSAMQVLKWENLRWDRDENGNHLPDTAHFVCEAQGCVIEEQDKPGMIENGEWVAERPFNGNAGFAIWAAYSLFPNAAWRHLVAEFLRVRRDPLELRTFVNTVLGETWEEKAEKIDSATLVHRGENYGPDSIPAGVMVLAAGVDVQGDRLEVQVFGWGFREECWAIEYEVIHGDPAQQMVWDDLDLLLLRKYRNDTGRELRVRAACIDTGGHHQNAVLAFCKSRRARRIFPVKGAAGPRPIWPKRESRTSSNETIFIVGVDTAKDTIYSRLRIGKHGQGYMHFPVGGGFDQAYFDQLTSERVMTRKRLGRSYRVWEVISGRRNEGLDTAVYALAARMSLPIRLDAFKPPPPPAPRDPLDIEGGEADIAPLPRADLATMTPQAPPPQPPAAPSGVKHSAFVGNKTGWLDRDR
jgi:phage terminase large subunit GpA-like protein